MSELAPGSGGAKRQKSSTELTVRLGNQKTKLIKHLEDVLYAFWQIDVWLDPVPHWLVPNCPCSVCAGTLEGKYVAVYCAKE